MKRLFLSTLIVAAFAAFSFAQSTDDYKKGEFYVGYSANVTDVRDANNDPVIAHGVNVSGVYNLSKYVGVKGDFSTHHEYQSSVQRYVGGIQVKNNSQEGSRVKPFAHAMVGVAAFNGIQGSAFTMTLGGGVDVRVNKRVSIRVIQFDWVPVISDGYASRESRVGFGVVF